MYLIMSLALSVCAAVGFGYGLFRFFRDEEALYIRMIVFAVGCAMLGRIFETLLLLVNGQIGGGFNVGMLGIAGSFLFLFSANYGQMDSIVDDGSKQFIKTRVIALAAPLAVMGIWCFLVASKGLNQTTIAQGVESMLIALAAYFHLKHVIIKDVVFGIIRSVRNYNILALVYALICMLEMIVKSFNLPSFCIIIVYVLLCGIMLAFIPVLERGMKNWTI